VPSPCTVLSLLSRSGLPIYNRAAEYVRSGGARSDNWALWIQSSVAVDPAYFVGVNHPLSLSCGECRIKAD
jgi:hypothetical protein